jgi:small GTP-binding protein
MLQDDNSMSTIPEQILALEEEIRELPYHKGTERHIGLLRARIARLKDKQIEGTQKAGSGGGGGYAVKKQGDATVVLVGPPSVGKSTLINQLTNAQSKVAPYAFTTLTVIPGMMRFKEAYIQILDVPGIIQGAEEGKGRGREVLSVIRGCDLVVVITDIHHLDNFESIEAALDRNGIRINQDPPDISIEKRPQGGMGIQSNIRQELSDDEIKDIAHEFGIRSAYITLREKITINRLTDAFSANRVYVKGMRVLNKIDELEDSNLQFPISNFQSNSNSQIKKLKKSELTEDWKLETGDYFPISADKGIGIEELKSAIWEKLGFLTIYLVEQYSDPDFENPSIVKKDDTLLDVAKEIGSEFAADKKSAKIWGPGAKFPGQEVSLSTKVQDGMQVRFL